MIKKIVPATDPLLRKKAKPIVKIDKKVLSLAQDLKDTLKTQKDPEGVGLAACQIGKNKCMFAMVNQGRINIIVNPKILSTSKVKESHPIRKNQIMEGCLSIPYYYGPIVRPQKLTLSYQDLEGKTQKQIFQGFPAQIIQHEVDHLNGILFVDKLLAQGEKLYQLNNNEWQEVTI